MKDLNSRAQSSYNPDDIFFDDYDANQLRSILRNRRDVFKPESIADDVVRLLLRSAPKRTGIRGKRLTSSDGLAN